MATLTPQGQTAPVHDQRRLATPRRPRRVPPRRSSCAAPPLDRPMTSYHLVLGSVALLLIVGVMMVLSAA